MREDIKNWAMFLTECAGKGKEEQVDFVNRLEKNPGVYSELEYYYEHKDFKCDYKVDGFSVVDLLVWQVDHFKAYLDRPDEMNRYNQDRLVWSAFDSMLRMEEEGAGIKERLAEQTGTDFEGKSFFS